MSPSQIAGLYLGRRDQYGYPAPAGAAPVVPSPGEQLAARCFALGVRDPEVIAELRRALAEKAWASGKKKKRR